MKKPDHRPLRAASSLRAGLGGNSFGRCWGKERSYLSDSGSAWWRGTRSRSAGSATLGRHFKECPTKARLIVLSRIRIVDFECVASRGVNTLGTIFRISVTFDLPESRLLGNLVVWALSSEWLVIRSKPAVTVRIADYIVSTTRNRALPSATRP